jgi:hypothetical protein
LTNFNEQKFNVEVEKRLDEIFPDEIKINKNVKKANKMMQIKAIYNLKKILLSMEWEVTDNILSKYLNEIIQLQRQFQDNLYLKCLLQLQYIYGRFIKTYPEKIPLKTYTILYTLYGWMKKILANKKLSNFEKKKIVKQEIRKYKNFKKYFTSSKNILSQNKCYKYSSKKRFKTSRNKDSKKVMKKNVNQDELSNRQYLDNILLEMKKFIKKEIKILKYELCSGQLKPTNANKSVPFKPHKKIVNN